MRLLFIILLGAILRFTNLDWDAGGRLHPDEALIVNGALSIQFFSQLFPGFHDYNGLSVYLLRLFSLGIDNPIQLTLIGRYLSASLSTLTIPLVFLLGKKLWNTNAGILAAILFTFTPLSVQLAHFYTTESILVFLFTLLLISTTIFFQSQLKISLVAMGVTTGLLLATKNTGYLFLPIPFSVILLQKNNRKAFSLTLLVLLALLSFFLASPYSFLDFTGYLARSRYLSDVVSGKLLMDWTMQFQQTNGFFWIKNILFAFGPLALIGGIGIIGNLRTLGFALWSVGFYLFLSLTYLKFIRYSAPLMPLFALFAAKFLWDIQKSTMGKILLAIVVTTQIIWTAMFFHIYLIPHPAFRAASWITQHIPPKSTILREEWNSIVHFDTSPLMNKQYSLPMFNFYTLPDTQEKMDRLTKILETSDYIILESPKIKNTVVRQKNQYPLTSIFYQQLEMKKFGFVRVAQFTSHPRLGPLVINDEVTEETWYAFDHPTVTVYRKN